MFLTIGRGERCTRRLASKRGVLHPLRGERCTQNNSIRSQAFQQLSTGVSLTPFPALTPKLSGGNGRAARVNCDASGLVVQHQIGVHNLNLSQRNFGVALEVFPLPEVAQRRFFPYCPRRVYAAGAVLVRQLLGPALRT